MAVSASSALLTAGLAGSTSLLRSLLHIPPLAPAAIMKLKAVLEPLVDEPASAPAAAGSSSNSSSSSRRGTNGHLHPPPTPLPVLRSLAMGSDDNLTLNQGSTGVALFHDVHLFWGASGGSSLAADPTDVRLTLKNPPAKARVTVNGKQTCYGCRLRDKDVLSFTAMDGRTYKYLIRITEQPEHEATAVPCAASTAPATSGVLDTPTAPALTLARTPSRKRPAHADAALSADLSLAGSPTTPSSSMSDAQQLAPPPPLAAASSADLASAAEEFVCVVCMELQVQSTTLVPCGHSLCHSCVASTTTGHLGHTPSSSSSSTLKVAGSSCPTCRAAVWQMVPNRLIDNAVAALVKCPGFFKPDDVAVYQTRTEALHPLPAVSSSSSAVDGATSSRTRRPTKRARRGVHHRTPRHALPPSIGGGASLDSPICIE